MVVGPLWKWVNCEFVPTILSTNRKMGIRHRICKLVRYLPAPMIEFSGP